ncbi:MAG: hypothetical protein JNN28_18970 [Saprospiraceae bacterium]|nr:hypothetical protein [Saprospiraceae bacterium]
MKVNVFIVHAPEEKAVADRLMEWMYPMQDEVNFWHYAPPPAPDTLPLSWRILLPWYYPVDPRVLYREPLKRRRENAHIYLFLVSARSLKDERFEQDLALAIARRTDCTSDDLGPLVLPLILNDCDWKKHARIKSFEPLLEGKTLKSFAVQEEGFRRAVAELSTLINLVQVRIREARYYQLHGQNLEKDIQTGGKYALPYLGENPEQFDFNPPPPFRPADWLGWCLIALIVVISIGSFRKNNAAVSSLHLKARPDKVKEIEYPRENSMLPEHDTAKVHLPPIEE